MAVEKKMLCPLMKGPCIEDGAIQNGELVACRFWVRVQGKHPQSGVAIDHHDCALCWAPVLMIENTKVNRETGAAIESFRNEMSVANRNVTVMAASALSAGFNALHSSNTIQEEEGTIPVPKIDNQPE